MGCRGCYGPNDGVIDHGAKILTGIASALDANTQEEVEAILDTLPDPAGYFYRFHLPRFAAAPPSATPAMGHQQPIGERARLARRIP